MTDQTQHLCIKQILLISIHNVWTLHKKSVAENTRISRAKRVDKSDAICHNNSSEAIASTRAKSGHVTTKKTERRTQRKSSAYDVLPEKIQREKVAVQSPIKFGTSDAVRLFKICRETTAYLENLLRGVCDSRAGAIIEASNFARWLQFSGVVSLCETYPQAAPLTVDGRALRRLTDDVIQACGERMQGNRPAHNPNESRMDTILAKLEAIQANTAPTISSPLLHSASVVPFDGSAIHDMRDEESFTDRAAG